MIKLRVAVYIRVGANDPAMIESQKRRVLSSVARHPGWEVTETYTDIGGFKDTSLRPGLDKMMQDASEHLFDVLAASSITRLSRDEPAAQQMVEHLKRNGIRIIFANELSREEVVR